MTWSEKCGLASESLVHAGCRLEQWVQNLSLRSNYNFATILYFKFLFQTIILKNSSVLLPYSGKHTTDSQISPQLFEWQEAQISQRFLLPELLQCPARAQNTRQPRKRENKLNVIPGYLIYHLWKKFTQRKFNKCCADHFHLVELVKNQIFYGTEKQNMITFGENFIRTSISLSLVLRRDTNLVLVWKVVQDGRQGEVSNPSYWV